MKNKQFLGTAENLFFALADKTRLRLLNLMRDGEVCVHFFTEVLGESQPKISRHLAYLRNAGIVTARRDGKWMYYRIELPDDISTANILHATLNSLYSQDEMLEEFRKLGDLTGVEEQTGFHQPENISFHEAEDSYYQREELEIYLL